MAFEAVLQSDDCIKTDRVKPRTVLNEWITGGNHLIIYRLDPNAHLTLRFPCLVIYTSLHCTVQPLLSC